MITVFIIYINKNESLHLSERVCGREQAVEVCTGHLTGTKFVTKVRNVLHHALNNPIFLILLSFLIN